MGMHIGRDEWWEDEAVQHKWGQGEEQRKHPRSMMVEYVGGRGQVVQVGAHNQE